MTLSTASWLTQHQNLFAWLLMVQRWLPGTIVSLNERWSKTEYFWIFSIQNFWIFLKIFWIFLNIQWMCISLVHVQYSYVVRYIVARGGTGIIPGTESRVCYLGFDTGPGSNLLQKGRNLRVSSSTLIYSFYCRIRKSRYYTNSKSTLIYSFYRRIRKSMSYTNSKSTLIYSFYCRIRKSRYYTNSKSTLIYSFYCRIGKSISYTNSKSKLFSVILL